MNRAARMELYGRLKSFEGKATVAARVGKDAVNEPMIRHWCEAMGDANPAYTGSDAIAPPTMLQAWTMGGLSGNTERAAAYAELSALLDSEGYTSIVATDCEQEYLRPLRPGDRVTFDAVIESVSERKTTKLGTGHFITTRMDVYAEGQRAGTHRFRVLKYAPARRMAGEVENKAEAEIKGQAVIKAEAGAKEGARAEGGGGAQGGAGAPGRARRPRPVVNRDNAGFWEGVARHRLLIQKCGGCGTTRFPWLPGCHACGGQEWEAVRVSGEGTVFSYVVMHHPPFPAFDPPYAVGLIELVEGVRMLGGIVGVPHGAVRIGMPVRAEFLRVEDEFDLPVFRPLGRVGDGEGS